MPKKQFPLMLEPDQRERFEEAAENHPHASSLTAFLRIAAENEHQRLQQDDEPIEVDLSELEKGQEEIQNRLNDINELLEDIDTQTTYDPAIDECASQLIRYVPKIPEAEVIGRNPTADISTPKERATTAGRLIDIISVLMDNHDYDEYTIRRAAEKAETEFTDLHHTSVDNQLRYYYWNERDGDTEDGGMNGEDAGR